MVTGENSNSACLPRLGLLAVRPRRPRAHCPKDKGRGGTSDLGTRVQEPEISGDTLPKMSLFLSYCCYNKTANRTVLTGTLDPSPTWARGLESTLSAGARSSLCALRNRVTAFHKDSRLPPPSLCLHRRM